jgi:hypothetical protein
MNRDRCQPSGCRVFDGVVECHSQGVRTDNACSMYFSERTACEVLLIQRKIAFRALPREVGCYPIHLCNSYTKGEAVALLPPPLCRKWSLTSDASLLLLLWWLIDIFVLNYPVLPQSISR